MIILAWLSVPNLVLLFALSAWLGGDACSGKVDAGHYFVGNRGHLTEVSKFAYHLSLYQIYSVFFGYASVFGLTAIGQIVRLMRWLRARFDQYGSP